MATPGHGFRNDREAYEALLEEIETNGPLYQIENDRGERSVSRFLKELIAVEWVKLPSPFVTIEPESIGKKGDLGPLQSCANDYLREAAKRLGLSRAPNVCKPRGEAGRRVEWAREERINPTTVQVQAAKFRRIVVLGKVFRTEASADFMLGARAMAAQCGIELVDKRGKLRMSGASDVAGYEMAETGILMRQAAEHAPDKDQDAILILFDDPAKMNAPLGILKRDGHHIVTTGYDRGTIYQEDDRVGILLGERSIKEESSRAYAVQFLWNQPSHAPSRRLEGIEMAFSLSGRGAIKIIPVKATDDPPFDAAAAQAIQQLKEIDQATPLENAAIFSRSEGVTREVIRFVTSLDPENARPWEEKPRVYSERLISSDLRYLAMESSPLRAICGVPFYVYGQYAVWAASRRWGNRAWTPLPPLLVGKDEAVKEDLVAVDRILPRYYEQLSKIEGDDFEWVKRPKR